MGRTERLTEVLNPDEDWGSLVCATEPIAWNSAPYASCSFCKLQSELGDHMAYWTQILGSRKCV